MYMRQAEEGWKTISTETKWECKTFHDLGLKLFLHILVFGSNVIFNIWNQGFTRFCFYISINMYILQYVLSDIKNRLNNTYEKFLFIWRNKMNVDFECFKALLRYVIKSIPESIKWKKARRRVLKFLTFAIFHKAERRIEKQKIVFCNTCRCFYFSKDVTLPICIQIFVAHID